MREILRGTAALVLFVGCASTTLDVPAEHAADPDAPEGQLAEPSAVLREPPAAPAADPGEPDEPHHGHHGHGD